MKSRMIWIILIVTALVNSGCCFAGPAPTAAPAPSSATSKMYIDRERSQVWRQPSGASENEIVATVEGHPGDQIWARRNGRALLRWPDLYIRLYSDSRNDTGLRMTDATPAWLRLGLAAGAAHITGQPAAGQRVELTTANARVLLTGTSIMLAYHPGTRSTVVRVFQGEVEGRNVAASATVATLRAGQWALIRGDAPPRVSSRLEDMRPLARELGLWDLFHQIELEAQAGFGPPGAAVNPAQVQIVFVEQAAATATRRPQATPTRKPTPTKPPTRRPTSTKPPTRRPTSTKPPTRTSTPTTLPTRTPTPTVYVPAIQMRYWADQECLLDTDCTTLRWEVDNAQEVTLNGEGVGGYDSRLACPLNQTGEYTLRAVRGAQSVEHTIVLSRVTAELSADRAQIEQGECTTLRWDVEGAREVYVNGEGVAGHDSRQVCPGATTRYDLHVESDCGAVDRAVTVEVAVAPPSDTVGPTIGGIDTQPPGDMLCEVSRIDVSTWIVDDISGVRNAELWVLYIPYGSVGVWDSVPMERSGDWFSVSLSDLSYGTVTIFVRAWDNAGNASETEKRQITISLC